MRVTFDDDKFGEYFKKISQHCNNVYWFSRKVKHLGFETRKLNYGSSIFTGKFIWTWLRINQIQQSLTTHSKTLISAPSHFIPGVQIRGDIPYLENCLSYKNMSLVWLRIHSTEFHECGMVCRFKSILEKQSLF